MCGIAAILDPAGATASGAAAGMADALRHRGPDGDAVRAIGPVTLVHTRLAIIDVEGGDQPLDSEDGAVTAIVNGEIYNHLELRAEPRAGGPSLPRPTRTRKWSSTPTRNTAPAS